MRLGTRTRRSLCNLVGTVMAATTLLAAGPALAQDADAPAEPVAAPAAEVKKVGEYSGVAGEDGGARVKRGKPGKHPRVYWIGFRARDEGGARLFIQLDREVAASQSVRDGKLVIGLGDARAAGTVLRALDTRFFESAVARIAPVVGRGGKLKLPPGLHLVVSFKDGTSPAEGSISSAQGKDGLTYLSIDFPSGASPSR